MDKKLYELRYGRELRARGSHSFCRTRLFQLTGSPILDTGWSIEFYFEIKRPRRRPKAA